MKKDYGNSKMPNSGGGKGMTPDSGSSGTNHGKSSGLRKEPSQRPDVMKAPSNKNHYPHGQA